MKGYRRYFAVIVLLFGALVLLEYFRPKPVDWSRSFSSKDKIPYGTYALFELLPGLFDGEPVISVRQPAYNLLQDETVAGNYISISESFVADSLDMKRMLEFVQRGNQVFLAAEEFSKILADTLHFRTEMLHGTHPDSTALAFTDPALPETYTYPANNMARYLVVEDSARHIQLGRNKAGKLNFMQVPFGKGSFFISTVPLAFTNYGMITMDQSGYTATALSYLPVQPVYWDEYQQQGQTGNKSVFRVLLNYEPLIWAFYLALFSLVLFLLFQSKRTQRIIPVIEPPRNTTLDFVKVIGSLYHNHGDHRNIAEKKIAYFLEYLRMHYHVATHVWNEELRERVVTKSGADAELVSRIFQLIDGIRQSNSISKQTLMQLNKHLEDFYRQTSTRPLAQQ